eukprot:scaffold10955_cov149-Ochromonas_danica.AAC.1
MDAFPDNKTETDDGRQNTPSVAEHHAPISDGSFLANKVNTTMDGAKPYNVFRKNFSRSNRVASTSCVQSIGCFCSKHQPML